MGASNVYNRRLGRLQAPAPGENGNMCGIVGFLDKRGGTDKKMRSLVRLHDHEAADKWTHYLPKRAEGI